MTDKSNTFIITHSLTKFYPFNPKVEQVLLEDIAYALAGIRRWGAHANYRYTVGQHSLEVAEWIKQNGGSRHEQLCGLMHDAGETYLQDIAAPIKNFLTEYLEIERTVEEVIAAKFRLQYPFPEIVWRADIACREHEAQHLFDSHPMVTGKCFCKKFVIIPEETTNILFQEKFSELTQ